MSFRKIFIFFTFSILVLYGGLLFSLFYFWDTSRFLETLFSKRTLFSIKISFIAATVASIFSVLFAIPSAYALSRYEFKGKPFIDTILELPMIVSPAALGAMILIFFNNPVGIWIQKNFVHIVFTFYGIILAQFISVLGIATRLIKATIDEIPKRYEEVAISLGVSPLKSFFTITLPLCKNGILSAAILSWAKALGEFGTTITVAGTIPMKTETLPIAIFMKLATADIKGTVTLIFILTSVGLSPLYFVRVLNNRNKIFK
ncbi:MAG: ABC transporter permease [Endomicrobiia bacterium]